MGTRRVPPPAAPHAAPRPPPPPAVRGLHCRTCWRELCTAETLLLPCGDVICRACLGERARGALATPDLALLPLRCCWTSVPAAMVAQALTPPERVFYAFRTRVRVDQLRTKVVTEKRALATQCEFCMARVQLATPQHAHQLLLDCGHVYCAPCVATLKQAAEGDGAICCRELQTAINGMATTETVRAPRAAAALPTMPTPAAPTMTMQADETTPTEAPRRPSARRSGPIAPPHFQGKGKRKLQRAPVAAAASDPNVVNLLDDSDDDEHDELIGHHDDDDDLEVCITCAKQVDAATNRFRAACGHVFCRTCLHERCLRALRNEEQGSIGIPVRCCDALVPLELLRAVLSKRNFVKYEALVAKRGDTAMPTAPRNARKRKQPPETAAAAKRTRPPANDESKQADDDAPAECVACMADVDNAKDRLKGPCGHVYCLTCLAMMAKQSLEDRALVPIRCCSQEFPIDYVKRVLNKTQFLQYDRFLKEKDWRTSDLKSDKEYAAMVKAINGKQCPTCGVGVQKISGCDAMRCLRGHLFCFACEGAPCTCGRTRLEAYGWVPPGTQPNRNPHAAVGLLGRMPPFFGGAMPGLDHALLHGPGAFLADLMRVRLPAPRAPANAVPAPAAAARPRPKARPRR